MSFTDQKPFVVTQADKKALTRYDKRFNCRLCGRHFMEGDTARWVYANGVGSPVRCGNFFVCSSCDGDDVLERAAESFNLAMKLAKQWDIYGPEWQESALRCERG